MLVVASSKVVLILLESNFLFIFDFWFDLQWECRLLWVVFAAFGLLTLALDTVGPYVTFRIEVKRQRCCYKFL